MSIRTFPVADQQFLARAKAFAESFGHRLDERLNTFILCNEENVWVGYFQLERCPVVLMGLHPELSKGRVAVECIKKVQHWSEVQNGACLAGVNATSPLHDAMPRLGFKDTGLKIFKTVG